MPPAPDFWNPTIEHEARLDSWKSSQINNGLPYFTCKIKAANGMELFGVLRVNSTGTSVLDIPITKHDHSGHLNKKRDDCASKNREVLTKTGNASEAFGELGLKFNAKYPSDYCSVSTSSITSGGFCLTLATTAKNLPYTDQPYTKVALAFAEDISQTLNGFEVTPTII